LLSRIVAIFSLCLLVLPIGVARKASTSSSVATLPAFLDVIKDGAIDGLNLADAAVVSPDGAHVYVVSEGDRAVAVFGRNTASGSLSFIELHQDGVNGVDGLSVVVAAAISPDGQHLYTASRGDDAVAAFSRNAVSGTLAYVEMQKDGVGGVDGLDGAHAIVVSPDGKHVYASSETDDAVAVFSRSTITGGLTFVEAHKDGVAGVDGLNTSRGLAISPDGKHVYATGQQDNALAAFSRDPITGSLTFVEALLDGTGGVDGLSNPEMAVISPDGLNIYVAATGDNAVGVFSRNALGGTLAFVERKQDGVGGVDGLRSTQGIAISPDGQHVYATSTDDDTVAVFSRSAITGTLTFVEMKQDGVGDVDGLDFARGVAVSPDGRHVYVAGEVEDALAVFSRNAASGALTFVEALKNGVGGVEGLDGAYAVSVSPSGRHVYVVSEAGDTLATLERDAASGLLTFMSVQRDGVNGVDGLNGARAVIARPDGKHIYVAGFLDDAVAIFQGEQRVFLPLALR
jgi:6-phosphogluconolactonase (cycloisomerase 2 family)